MSALSADDLASLTEALRLLTAATRKTGIHFDGGSLNVTAPNGGYLSVRWTKDNGGQYVLDLTQN